MKTKFMIFLLLLSSSAMFAQPWMTGGNAAAPGDYLGTNNNQPLNFYTNGIGRMLIENGGVGFAEGRIAMFNTLPVGFAAQDRLHLHQNVRGPLIRFTNNGTGSSNTDGFRVGINDVAIATLQNFENTAMEFYNNNIQRMHINADNGTTDGFIGMGNG